MASQKALPATGGTRHENLGVKRTYGYASTTNGKGNPAPERDR